jgi:hypothetical protein
MGLATLDDMLGVIVSQHLFAEVRLHLSCKWVTGTEVLQVQYISLAIKALEDAYETVIRHAKYDDFPQGIVCSPDPAQCLVLPKVVPMT